MAKKWWTLLAVCSGTFMLLLDTTIVYVALPSIRADLGGSFADVQWVVDGYALALASLLLTAGIFADRFGRRRLYAIGLIVFTSGSALCGAAQSPLMLILSRAFQGIGGSMMFATGLALLAGAFEGKQRGTAFGVWGMVTGIASGLGPIVGGLFTTDLNWRGIFFVNVPIGVLALAVVLRRVDEARAPKPRALDWPGFALLTTGLVGLIYGLIRAGEQGWTERTTLAVLAAGTILLIAFLVAEAVNPRPMFDLSLFRIPTFLGGSIAAFAMNGSMFAMFLFLAIYYQGVLGYSALATGVRFLIPSGAMFASSLLAGRLSTRMPVRLLIGGGLLVVGAGLLLMGSLSPTTGWTHFIPGFIIAGLGAGVVNPPLASTALGVVELGRSGMASGVNATFRQIGLCTSVAVLGSLQATVVGDRLASGLAGTALARDPQLAAQVRAGALGQAAASVPAQLRGELIDVARAGLTSAVNDLLLVTGILALAGGVLSLLLIRAKDFAAAKQQHPAPKPADSASDDTALATS